MPNMSPTAPVMQCPHANGVLRGSVRSCPTCENSAAAHELRDLRRVARAAMALVDRMRTHDGAGVTFLVLEDALSMAKETSPALRVGEEPRR